jgi:hypothetical protein
MFADDAGAGNQHIMGQEPQASGGEGRNALGVGEPLLSGAGVGAAAIDHDGLSPFALEVSLT